MKRVNKLFDKLELKYLFLFCWVIISLFYLVELIVNNLAIDDGERLQSIQQQTQEIKLQNMILENEIATKSSLKYTEQLAKSWGFKEDPKVRYLK